jgi:quercetin dioxygenase-like cupin family protein
MTHAHPQSWSEISSLAISEDAVRQLHPAESHKLYLNVYPAAEAVSVKASHAFVLYVLQGECTLTIAGAPVTLAAAQLIHLEAGVFECVAGTDGVRLMKVFQRA